ncbi:MAG TPA: hypothetical protein IAA98_07240 [Candidatus Avipropionibacterium avicola]|uniref:Uncharacterized protein n=1 Tax=Candidatus Avipropionibacterium avicola TaxID=2840701 RepID=A0A9D1KM66_9ACTN|nr:hypothetical protein [Candidatus Avipropionibacterium avicola]
MNRSTLSAAALASAVLMVQCLAWLLFPALNPYAGTQLSMLAQMLLGPTAFTGLLGALGLVGAVTAGIATLRPQVPGTVAMVRIVSPVLTLLLFAATMSMSALAVVGYLVALLLPVAGIAVVIVAAVRSARARPWMVLLGVGIIVAAVLAGPLVLAVVADLLPQLVHQLDQVWALVVSMSTLGLWIALSVAALRGRHSLRRITAWLVRHRVVVTLLAAAGPLPYALARLSWLTPWPIGRPAWLAGHDQWDAWGIMLSLGAWWGAILTVGLIRPWGEVVPRWLPVIGGRTVPPAAAIVPGALVATLVTMAAIPLLVQFSWFNPEMRIYLLLLPLWYWGPLLGLAVWAYAGHRARMVR